MHESKTLSCSGTIVAGGLFGAWLGPWVGSLCPAELVLEGVFSRSINCDPTDAYVTLPSSSGKFDW